MLLKNDYRTCINNHSESNWTQKMFYDKDRKCCWAGYLLKHLSNEEYNELAYQFRLQYDLSIALSNDTDGFTKTKERLLWISENYYKT